jgi:hypothetical protein
MRSHATSKLSQVITKEKLTMIFNVRHLDQVTIAATVAIGSLSMVPSSAQAIDFGGWDYANSSYRNGVQGANIGGNVFEFHSMAVKDLGDRFIVALNANLDPNGGKDGIAYGDLLFNFTPKNLKGASDQSALFGVKFQTLNSDSGVSQTGIYSGVKAKAVGTQNSGFSNFDQRTGYLANYTSTATSELNNLGDLQTTDAYFDGMRTGNNVLLNSIKSGTRVGDISMLNKTQLSGLGVDFGHFNATGTQTFGFSFIKPKGFEGNFTSTLAFECFNDAVALTGTSKKAPEPLALAGLAVVGAALARKRRVAQS